MSRWGAEADRDLLLTIIKDQQLSTAKWGEITAEMEAKGYKDLGPWACRKRFQKLRDDAKGGAKGPGPDGGDDGDGSPEKPKKVATPRKKKLAPADEEGENAISTPTKRKRASPKKKEAVKAEADGEMDGAAKREVQKQLGPSGFDADE